MPFTSVSKRVLVQNHSNENVFELHENEHESKTYFDMKGFALGLVLKQRQKKLGDGLFNDRSLRNKALQRDT